MIHNNNSVLQQQQCKWFWSQTLLNILILITFTLHEQFLWTFISLNLFFCAIKNQFFQTLIHMLNSEFVIQLSDWTKFCDLLNQIYDAILKNLITDWESFIKISFAVDDWSSSNKLSFLDMNCYYISENWKYWERLVEFELLFDSHDNQNLKEIVKRIIFK